MCVLGISDLQRWNFIFEFTDASLGLRLQDLGHSLPGCLSVYISLMGSSAYRSGIELEV